jgi:hypothetical protein
MDRLERAAAAGRRRTACRALTDSARVRHNPRCRVAMCCIASDHVAREMQCPHPPLRLDPTQGCGSKAAELMKIGLFFGTALGLALLQLFVPALDAAPALNG